MRCPAAEKLEIIRLVERSHLPVRRTLDKLAFRRPHSTGGTIATGPSAGELREPAQGQAETMVRRTRRRRASWPNVGTYSGSAMMRG